ncbi:MAG: GNAT family N-acetyltransferase [Candidatus Nanopelagicales bacterium]
MREVRSGGRADPPIANSPMHELAEALRSAGPLGGAGPCPANPDRAHESWRRGPVSGSRCLDKALSLAVHAPARGTSSYCGMRNVRMQARYSSLEVGAPPLASVMGVVDLAGAEAPVPPHGTTMARAALSREAGEPVLEHVTPGAPAYGDALAEHRMWLGARFPGTLLAREEAAQVVMAAAALSVLRLRVRGRAVATALCAVDEQNASAYYYSPAFDAAFARFSPGSLLLYALLDWCRDTGIRYVDIGSMGHPYKHRIASSGYSLALAPVGVNGRPLGLLLGR